MFVEPFEQYKEHLLIEVNNADILVENKLILLDIVDDMMLGKNDPNQIFLSFREYGIEVCTYRTFYNNIIINTFLENNI